MATGDQHGAHAEHSDHGGLLSIGGFALLSGLSIPALRHYGDVGLLPPATVDARTGYRRYSRDQLGTARIIRTLRSVDLPLDDIAAVLDTGDDAALRAALLAHTNRLRARSREVDQLLARTNSLLERGLCMTELATTARVAELSLIVDDAEQVANFYRDVFDVEFSPDRHDGPEHYHASFGSWPGADFFMLTVWPSGSSPPMTSHLGFVVDDLDATWARAQRAGAEPVNAPRDSDAMPRNAKLLDPAGNHVMLYQS